MNKMVRCSNCIIVIAVSVQILRADDFQTLNQQVNTIRAEIGPLQDRAKRALRLVRNEKETLWTKQGEVFSILVNNDNVVHTNKILEHSPVGNVKNICLKSFIQGLKSYKQELSQNFTEALTTALSKIENDLEQYQKNLKFMKNTLNNDSNRELWDCKRTEASCRIKEFQKMLKNQAELVVYPEAKLSSVSHQVLEVFKLKIIPETIHPRLLAPALACEKRMNYTQGGGVVNLWLADFAETAKALSSYDEKVKPSPWKVWLSSIWG
ncbi:hypothetical protein QAD02_015578 [Eretmocerus hayati]|uniref:Uncharacterized protein n=1 Tax=Eretmocerus hayati TaxID=131215 RepID=A0ACC2P8M8_9HYME|nr:hypothetical protein QAD02_015578 [Eretmocerus hayati]